MQYVSLHGVIAQRVSESLLLDDDSSDKENRLEVMNPIIHKDNVNVNTHALADLPTHVQLSCNEIHKHLAVFKNFIVRCIRLTLCGP